MKAYLSRWVSRDVASNLGKFEEEASAAAAGGASLVVFPESFLHGYTRTADPAAVRAAFQRVSCAHPTVLFAFGSFTEERRNRLTAWLGGREAARYDKVHLFEPNGELALWEPGERYVALRALGLTWGFLNCNDVRFPEQARALRLRARCDALVIPAWWPWRRDHVWTTLLRARAMENAVWVLGCCIAASEYPGEAFAGAGNYVFDPLGEPVRTLDDRTYDLDFERPRGLIVDPLDSFRDIQDVRVFEPSFARPLASRPGTGIGKASAGSS